MFNGITYILWTMTINLYRLPYIHSERNLVFMRPTLLTNGVHLVEGTLICFDAHVSRLWFHVEGVGCPSNQPSSAAPALVCRTFLPKSDERFEQLIHRVNKRFESDRLGGEIQRLFHVSTYIILTLLRHLCNVFWRVSWCFSGGSITLSN